MQYHRFIAAAFVALPTVSLAQPSPPGDTPGAILPPVGVTATRGARPIDQVPTTVSVIDDRQLERQDAIRPSDVVRYEPGVTVGNQPARGGQTNYVIRGIGDNRVLILQDGLRVQDFPSSNLGASNYTRNFIDLDTMKRVEIVRGPASALYGSDALGGVINYILKDPLDYLEEAGRDYYISGKLGYNGSDNSLHETITGAARGGKSEIMLLYTRRDGHETQANGSIGANPQTYYGNSVLGRIVLHATDVDTLRITAEYNELLTATHIRSEEVVTPPAGFTPGIKVYSSRGNDATKRATLTFDWMHDSPFLFIDTLRLRVSGSYLQRREQSDQLRANFVAVPFAAANRERVSDFFFNQSLTQADLQATTRRDLLGAGHLFTYGTSMDLSTTSRPRDRFELNLANGTVATTVAGESFPNKNFPDTTTARVGLYAQDEISLGRLDLTPALRIDLYKLDPHPDAAFNRSGGGVLTVNPVTEVAVSPKFGALFHLTDQYSVYGQYAHGYRAPPYDTTNFGFTNPAFGYQILPNGSLKSEASDGVELGFRGKFHDGSFQVNNFYNQYSNFIDTRVVGLSSGGLTQFKYVNVPNVRIWGTEARGEYRVMPQVTLRAALAWARGEDSQTGNPIDSVDPVKLVTGISWQHPSGFGADANLTHAWRHDRVSTSTFFKTPSYTTIDLLVRYEYNRSVTINGGIFNVTNEKYFVSQDVTGLAADNPSRDLFAQPGRYIALNTTVRF